MKKYITYEDAIDGNVYCYLHEGLKKTRISGKRADELIKNKEAEHVQTEHIAHMKFFRSIT